MRKVLLFLITFFIFSGLGFAQTQGQQAQTVNIEGFQPATSNVSNESPPTNVAPFSTTTTTPSNSTTQSSTVNTFSMVLSCTPGEFTQTIPSQGTTKIKIIGWAGDKCHMTMTDNFPNPNSQNNISSMVAECYLSKQTLNDMQAMKQNLLQIIAAGDDSGVPKDAIFKMLGEIQKECTISVDGKSINLPLSP